MNHELKAFPPKSFSILYRYFAKVLQSPSKEDLEMLSPNGATASNLCQEDLDCQWYETFGRDVYPYSSCYTHPKAQVTGGMWRGASKSFTLKDGHVSEYLAILRHLTGAPLEVQQDFFDSGGLDFLLPFCATLQNLPGSVFSKLGPLILETVCRHMETVDANLSKELSKVEPLTKNPRIDRIDILLKRDDVHWEFSENIAEDLTIPANCGFLLTHSMIKEMARRLKIPIGFGSRKVILQNLIAQSAKYGTIGLFLELLLEICTETDDIYCRYGYLTKRIDWQKKLGQFLEKTYLVYDH
jgi:hypothetical protein